MVTLVLLTFTQEQKGAGSTALLATEGHTD